MPTCKTIELNSDGVAAVPKYYKCGYLRVRTDQKLNEWLAMVDFVESGTLWKMTATQLSIWTMLTDRTVSRSTNAYFIKMMVEDFVRVHYKETLTPDERASANATKLALTVSCGKLKSKPERRWALTPPVSAPVMEAKDCTWEMDIHTFDAKADVAQVVFYSNPTAVTWIKEGWLLVDGKEVAHFSDPFEAILLDKEALAMPVPKSPIFTFTFADYLDRNTTSEFCAKMTTRQRLSLKLLVDPQRMGASPHVEAFAVVKK